MAKRPKLQELIARANEGDEEAFALLVEKIMPLVKKYGQRMGYEGACSDLVLWVIKAVRRYRPYTKPDKEEMKSLLNEGDDDEKNI